MSKLSLLGDRVAKTVGPAAGTLYGAGIGAISFSGVANLTQKAVWGNVNSYVDSGAACMGGLVGASIGYTLSKQNPNKSVAILMGTVAGLTTYTLLNEYVIK